MGRQARIGTLVVSVLLVMIGGHAARSSDDAQPPFGSVITPASVAAPASVTAPEPRDAVVVPAAVSPNNRGWRALGPDPAAQADSVRAELMDAYSLAVANAPSGCHLSSSLLAAIGQVESGNLAGHRIDAKHRVRPAVLGPVLDGDGYVVVKDTDDGTWDRNHTWDRAIGPMQLLPATWRVVGLDLDEDGVRDPQNIYDAAGAAMVYLCDGGRDLSTQEGLVEAVLAYNHSRAYLRQVLAWKTAFDGADLVGYAAMPSFGAWAAAPEPFVESPAPASSRDEKASVLAATRPTKTDHATARPTTPARSAAPAKGSTAPGNSSGTTASTPNSSPSKTPGTAPVTPQGTTPAKGPAASSGQDPAKKSGNQPGSTPSADPEPGAVVATPADPSTCVPAEPTTGAEGTALEPDEATHLLAEGTPVCCVAPDGTATLLTPTGTPTPAATALPESCEDATVVPVPEATAPPAG